MYEMKPEYLTGIDFIDEEHKRLFEIANEAHELLNDQFIPDKYDYIMQVIENLKDYTKYHLNHEEEYMNNIKYKRILSQKVAHSEFIEKLDQYNSDSIDEHQKESLLELLDFLTSWLIHHILKSDTLIGKE